MKACDNTSLKYEITFALAELGLPTSEIADKEQTIAVIASTFIKGTPRAWWPALIQTPKIFTFENNSGYLHIHDIAPPATSTWLVTDECNEEKLAFNIPLEAIPSVLERCRFFEYYIVDTHLNWLLAENDRGDLLLAQANVQPTFKP
ncbi:hypothetical protein [Pseudomonas fontis]|uniref:Uncharacterized protein n=1 Tax=Pseudomonas fontis TaxID=2942633 RepID=A0ABT5NY45_9PSED|nr:hypothetical protein [Pseudomonas fontis]MDD0977465.1 hypothetical protein [Pseudomonas fontis]MDD0993085.1 hypothetical protein [Pseudomonas fontis]